MAKRLLQEYSRERMRLDRRHWWSTSAKDDGFWAFSGGRIVWKAEGVGGRPQSESWFAGGIDTNQQI